MPLRNVARFVTLRLRGRFFGSGQDVEGRSTVEPYSTCGVGRRMHRRVHRVVGRPLLSDVYLSTLRSYIQAMGGELEIIARFPDGAVRVNQFRDVDAPEPTRS